MSQFIFGAGMMIAIPKKPTPTPRVLGTMQEVSVEFSGSTKELFGQHQFAEAVARGQQKIACKAKYAGINMNVYNEIYFNENVLQGQNLAIFNKEFAVDKTAFTVTPTLEANSLKILACWITRAIHSRVWMAHRTRANTSSTRRRGCIRSTPRSRRSPSSFLISITTRRTEAASSSIIS